MAHSERASNRPPASAAIEAFVYFALGGFGLLIGLLWLLPQSAVASFINEFFEMAAELLGSQITAKLRTAVVWATAVRPFAFIALGVLVLYPRRWPFRVLIAALALYLLTSTLVIDVIVELNSRPSAAAGSRMVLTILGELAVPLILLYAGWKTRREAIAELEGSRTGAEDTAAGSASGA